MRFTGLAIVSTLITAALCGPIYTEPLKAVVVLSNASQNITGTVTFTQSAPGWPTEVFAKVQGLVPESRHGLHVHATGDLTNGCDSLGLHFNPHNQDHGSTSSKVRHIGDFGNIVQYSDEYEAALSMTIQGLELSGVNSIVGRGLVLHSGTDDLGLSDSPLSKTVGNSGARLACGVIGFAAPE